MDLFTSCIIGTAILGMAGAVGILRQSKCMPEPAPEPLVDVTFTRGNQITHAIMPRHTAHALASSLTPEDNVSLTIAPRDVQALAQAHPRVRRIDPVLVCLYHDAVRRFHADVRDYPYTAGKAH